MRNLHARIRKLEEAEHGADLVDVLLHRYCSEDPIGTLRVAGVVVARLRNERDEAYRARAFSVAPVTGNGVRIVDEAN